MPTQYSTKSADQKIILDLKVNSAEAIAAIVAAKEQIAKLKEEQKQLEAEMKKGGGTKEMQERLVLINTEIKDLNSVVKANQRELDETVKSQKQNADSINAMRAQIKLLRQEYEDLSKSERESAQGTDLLKHIDELQTEVLGLEKAQQDYTRQVGNYELAAKPARTALREMRMECQNLALELNKTKGAIEAQKTVVDSLAKSVGTESDEYKQAVAQLNALNKAYNETEDNLSKMEQQTGELADTLADSSDRIKSFANDQQRIAAAQEGVAALSAAYDAIQGSLTALGVKSEAMVEIYSKMQIVQRSLNGLMTIYKTLNKDSNLMIVARQKIEKARLVWTKAYNAALKEQNVEVATNTAAEGANATAVTATTVAETAATGATFSLKAAFEALKATLLSNPITAIALAVTTAAAAIGTAVSKIIKKNKEAKESEKELAEETKKVTAEYKAAADKRAAAMNSVTSKYTDQIAKVKALLSVIHSETAAYSAKVKAIAELNRMIPEYNGQLSKTGQILKENTAAIDKFISNLQKQAEAAATMNALTSAYEIKLTSESSKLQAEKDLAWYNKKFKYWLEERDRLWLKYGSKEHEMVQPAEKELQWYQQRVTATEAYIKELTGAMADANKQIDYFSKHAKDLVIDEPTQTSGGTTTKQDNPELKLAQDMYNEMLKIASDYYKGLEKLQEDALTTMTQKEEYRYAGEREQLEKALADANKLYEKLSKDPKLLKELQKDNKYLTLENLQKQIGILTDELDNAEKRHLQNIAKINEETNSAFNALITKLQSELDQASDNATVRYTAQLQERLSALDAELKKELDAHEYTEAQKLAITEKYNQKKSQILNEFSSNTSGLGNYSGISNINTLNSQLAADLAELQARQDAELAVFKGTEEEKKAIVEKYANMRVNIEERASKQEAQIWLNSTISIAQAMSTALGGMQDLLNTIAEDDAEMQKYSKALALSQIAISTGLAIAQAVQAAVQAGGFTGPAAPVTIPVFIAELVGIVGGAVASAIATLKDASTPARPRFATGGPVDRSVAGGMIGKHTTRRKDDTVDAKLSLGEYVIKSEVVQKYGVGFFDELNGTKRKKPDLPLRFAGGGSVPSMETISTTELSMDYTQMEDMFTRVVENIQPVVSVTEITDKQNRVKVKENTASY